MEKIKKARPYLHIAGNTTKADGSVVPTTFKATVIEVKKRADDEEKPSKVQGSGAKPTEDTQFTRYGLDNLIAAPYDLLALVMIEEESNVLRECIDAMAVNIEGFGYVLRPRKVDVEGTPKRVLKGMNQEKVSADAWIMSLFPEVSISETRKRVRRDLELTGNAYYEVVRDLGGKVIELNHVPSYQIRLIKMDKEFTTYTIPYVDPLDDYKIKTRQRRKRFRRYIQIDSGGLPLVWFAEYGDPRFVNKKDGSISAKPKPGLKATELIHLKIYSPRSAYGIPRWIGRFVSVIGSRRSEEVNFFTLSNNHVPSMFVMVENGSLTEGSVERLQEVINSQISGDPNYSKIVILEAESGEREIFQGQITNAKINIKELTDAQRSDQMFQAYDKNNQDKVRQSFRLPPIFVGRADDYTRATAYESRRLADEQVFNPEREPVDSLMTRLMVERGFQWYTFKTKTPNITDNEVLAKAMAIAEKSGGMTPRRANTLMEDIFDGELGQMPAIDLDVPFTLQFAKAQGGSVAPKEELQDSEENQVQRAVTDWTNDVFRK